MARFIKGYSHDKRDNSCNDGGGRNRASFLIAEMLCFNLKKRDVQLRVMAVNFNCISCRSFSRSDPALLMPPMTMFLILQNDSVTQKLLFF